MIYKYSLTLFCSIVFLTRCGNHCAFLLYYFVVWCGVVWLWCGMVVVWYGCGAVRCDVQVQRLGVPSAVTGGCLWCRCLNCHLRSVGLFSSSLKRQQGTYSCQGNCDCEQCHVQTLSNYLSLPLEKKPYL